MLYKIMVSGKTYGERVREKAVNWIDKFDSSLKSNKDMQQNLDSIEEFMNTYSDSLDVKKFLNEMYKIYKKHKDKLGETTTQCAFEFFTKHMDPELKSTYLADEFDSSLMNNRVVEILNNIEKFMEKYPDSLDVKKFLDRMYKTYEKHKDKLGDITMQWVFEFFTKHMYPDLKSTYLADVFEDYLINNKKCENFKYLLNKIACFMREQDKTSMFNIWNSKVSDALLEKMQSIYYKHKYSYKYKLPGNEFTSLFILNWFQDHESVQDRWRNTKCSNSAVKQEIPQYLMKMISRPQRYNSKYNNLRY